MIILAGELFESEANQNSQTSFHVFALDPVFEELERIVVIIQNPDGSWGTGETLDERLYPTGWSVYALRSQEIVYPLEKCEKLIKTRIIPQLEDKFKLNKWLHIKKLCGLFLLLPYIYEKKLWKSSDLFQKNIDGLMTLLNKKDWFSSIVASYFVFSCSKISKLKKYVKIAKDFLRKKGKASASEISYISLGYPDIFFDVSESAERMRKFESEINGLTDDQLSHLLLGLSLIRNVKSNEKARKLIVQVKECIVKRLQNRHLTELDKKVTKEFLDLLLLLRANIPLTELQYRLKKLDSKVLIQDIERTDKSIKITTEIPSRDLQEILGKIDIPTICCYILGSSNLKEKHVYLLPEKDYLKIENYFRTKTFPVSMKRLFSYEVLLIIPILLIASYIWYLLYAVSLDQMWENKDLRISDYFWEFSITKEGEKRYNVYKNCATNPRRHYEFDRILHCLISPFTNNKITRELILVFEMKYRSRLDPYHWYRLIWKLADTHEFGTEIETRDLSGREVRVRIPKFNVTPVIVIPWSGKKNIAFSNSENKINFAQLVISQGGIVIYTREFEKYIQEKTGKKVNFKGLFKDWFVKGEEQKEFTKYLLEYLGLSTGGGKCVEKS